MRKPEEIQKEIYKLQEELRKSKLEYSLEPLWIENQRIKQEYIGLFQFEKARIILTALTNKKRLLIKHESIGNFIVKLNPQQNRILVFNEDGTELKTKCAEFGDKSCTWIPVSLINEDTIEGFILWYSGDWYIINDEYYGK